MPLNLQTLGPSQGHDAEEGDDRSCAGSRPACVGRMWCASI